MENIERRLVNIINILAQIPTRGDDTVRMGSSLVELRRIVDELRETPISEDTEDVG